MLEVRIVFAFEFWNDPLRKQLAELNSPLIERINVPNRALRENGVFVKSNETAERCGGEPLGQDGVGWPISFKYPMRDQPFRRTFGRDFIGCLPESERFGLGRDVGHQNIVMAADWVEGLGKGDKIARNQAGALMDQLIK